MTLYIDFSLSYLALITPLMLTEALLETGYDVFDFILFYFILRAIAHHPYWP